MNSKKLFPLFFIVVFLQQAAGQTIQFLYDENGNRTGRTLIVEELRSNNVSFPVKNTRSLISAKGTENQESVKDIKDSEEIKTEESEIKPLIYPNPTRGLLRIEVPNIPLNANTELRIYDLNGNQLIVRKDFGSEYDLDISAFKDGFYILKLKINEFVFDWKVIKRN